MKSLVGHRRISVRALVLGPLLLLLSSAPVKVGADALGPSLRAHVSAQGSQLGGNAFVENAGQYPDQILYVGQSTWGTLAIAKDGIWIIASRGNTGHALRLRFVGANPHAEVIPTAPLPGQVQHMKGSDPSIWPPAAKRWARLSMKDLYPGVDLEFGLDQDGRLWRAATRGVADASDLASIVLRVDGASRLVAGKDSLTMGTAIGDFDVPLIDRVAQSGSLYPVVTGHGDAYSVRCPFSVSSASIKQPRTHAEGGLLFSTFLGGDQEDRPWDIAVDREGFSYLTGNTESLSFPTTPGPFQIPQGEKDVFVVKMTSEGQLVYSALVGGNDDDTGLSIAVDAAGSAYVAGKTASGDFPTTAAAHDRSLSGNWDGFVAKLDPGGAGLSYATYLGGSGEEEVRGIALDATGNAYLTGWTYSGDFPVTPDSFDPSRGDSKDAFVAKLDSSGSQILYGGYVGGLLDEEGHAIAVDSTGNAYATGWTKSEDFESSPGAFQDSYSGYDDAFVAKVTADGRSLAYSTLLGGAGKDRAHDIVVDSQGSAYVTGETKSADFPYTLGAYSSLLAGREDIFVTKVSPDGQSLSYSTSIGGSSSDVGNALVLDEEGVAYITGSTLSNDMPVTADAYDRTFNWNLGTFWKLDVFAASLSADGSELRYCTYLGGTGEDQGQGIGIDAQGIAYLAGFTVSSGFPTTSALQDTLGGSWDGFVSGLSMGAPGPTPTPTATSSPAPASTPSPTPTRRPLPDLVVTSMRIELETPVGCLVALPPLLGIRAVVANLGSGDAGPFELEVNGTRKAVDEGLRAGAIGEHWFAGSRWPDGDSALVDPMNEIAEADEENNRLSLLLSMPTSPSTCTPAPSATPSATRGVSGAISLPLVLKAR